MLLHTWAGNNVMVVSQCPSVVTVTATVNPSLPLLLLTANNSSAPAEALVGVSPRCCCHCFFSPPHSAFPDRLQPKATYTATVCNIVYVTPTVDFDISDITAAQNLAAGYEQEACGVLPTVASALRSLTTSTSGRGVGNYSIFAAAVAQAANFVQQTTVANATAAQSVPRFAGNAADTAAGNGSGTAGNNGGNTAAGVNGTTSVNNTNLATVFAPTNQAVMNALKGLNTTQQQLLANKTLLQQVGWVWCLRSLQACYYAWRKCILWSY
eukprot:GHRR01002764.1.p1 GENE.GHRR01002764.1~~GHRR01002764.1.p1  ORF type:complete len:268 (+),score=83.00 GHRR01002764.1:2360-3163(+)